MNTSRNYQIDTAKGILMSLVIVGHVLLASKDLNQIESILLKAIYSFHMPAFLIISGLLFDCKKQKEKGILTQLSNKFRHIMIPYFVFELLGGIVQNIFTYGERETLFEVLRNVITFHMYVGADWYLLTYFLASLMVFIVNKMKAANNILPATAIMFFVVVCIYQQVNINDSQVFILRIMLSYSLIVVGIMLRNIMYQNNWNHLLIAVAGYVCALSFNSPVFMHAAMIGNPILFLIGGICGTYIVIRLSSRIKSKLMNLIGANSIVPMGIHQNLIWLFGWFFGLSGRATIIVPNLIFTYCVSILVTILYARMKRKVEYESHD